MNFVNSIVSIFLNPDIQKEAFAIRENLRMPTEDFEDLLTIPHTYSSDDFDKIESDIPKIIKEMRKNKKSQDFKQFEIYNLPACGYMEKRSELLQYKAVQKILTEEEPALGLIERASLHATKPMQAYSFKQFLAILDIDTEEFNYYDNYKGIQPYTSPVDRATRVLFGINFKGNQLGHSNFCIELARELNTIKPYDIKLIKNIYYTDEGKEITVRTKISPSYINTVLWLIGQRI